ncbi:MAG: decaprenyl-phosphate phosphoribosyltransferase [Oscillospiraceae bacterium]|nr:decaprenyl-phosphate phosphoribosyltransferase [Oscillospiraceae bacterium]
MSILRLLRIKHTVKNVFVLLPLIFNGSLLDMEALPAALWGFAAFCFLSPAVYIINDIRDAERDREHPVKRARPIASGAVSARAAAFLAGALIAASAAAQVLAGSVGFQAWLWLGLYLLINIAYSFGLKNIPIADVAILASGFLLRLLYGSAVTGIALSGWLCLTVTAFSFYLGLGKRRGELISVPDGSSREVLRRYTAGFLQQNMMMCMALAVVFYSLWSTDASTAERLGNHMVWTVPLVLIICLRYNFVSETGGDGDPLETMWNDKPLLCLVILFALITTGLIYGGNL